MGHWTPTGIEPMDYDDDDDDYMISVSCSLCFAMRGRNAWKSTSVAEEYFRMSKLALTLTVTDRHGAEIFFNWLADRTSAFELQILARIEDLPTWWTLIKSENLSVC